jgi:hypothetical protein
MSWNTFSTLFLRPLLPLVVLVPSLCLFSLPLSLSPTFLHLQHHLIQLAACKSFRMAPESQLLI